MSILKQRKKIFVFIIAFMMMLGTVIPLNTADVLAETVSINYGGNVSYGGSTVGIFHVNGQAAFCMEHAKGTPATGVKADSSIYNNANVQKVLYYGWGGPAQWSGFTSSDMGWVVTSLALDHFYTGGNHPGIAAYTNFLNYIVAQPAPPNERVAFDKSTMTVKWDVKNQKQVTDEVTITGDTGSVLKITVPNGATMIMADGTEKTGEATLTAGDRFHFEAPSTVSGIWNSGNVGRSFKYQPLLFKTASNSIQNLGSGKLISDPNDKVSLSVNWLDFGKLSVRKVNDKSDLLDGMKFNLKSADVNTGYGDPGVEYTVKDGKLDIDPIPTGTYMLTEVLSPDSYDKPVKNYQVVITKDQTTERIIVNLLKPTGETTITKTDAETGKPIEGVEFTAYAEDIIYDSVSFEKLYDKGNKVASGETDENGVCKIDKLPMGKYSMKETKEADGYVPNNKEYTYEFRQQDYTTKVYTETFDVTNKKTETQISKEGLGGKELPGATLQVYKDGELVEEWVSTDTPHVIKGLIAREEYILKETICPAGYIIATDITFKVSENKDVTKVTMKDDYTKVYISKQDFVTGKELKGAKLIITDKENQTVKEWTTNGSVTKIEAQLLPGEKYTLTEIQAPAGYEKADSVSFTVSKDGSIDKVVMKDKSNVVKTGDNMGTMIPILIVLLLVSGFIAAATVIGRKRV